MGDQHSWTSTVPAIGDIIALHDSSKTSVMNGRKLEEYTSKTSIVPHYTSLIPQEMKGKLRYD
jgi:hypothetical protein